MDRGAALNCRVIHNWDTKKAEAKNLESSESEDQSAAKDGNSGNKTEK